MGAFSAKPHSRHLVEFCSAAAPTFRCYAALLPAWYESRSDPRRSLARSHSNRVLPPVLRALLRPPCLASLCVLLRVQLVMPARRCYVLARSQVAPPAPSLFPP